MLRNLLGVVLGYSLWSGMWLGGNALFFAAAAESLAAEQGLTGTGTLLEVLGLSIVCSLAAGFLTAKVAVAKTTAVSIMAFLLLVTGILVQQSVWDLMPLWYHLLFLVLLLPMTRVGARIGG